jgi:ribosomal protein S9
MNEQMVIFLLSFFVLVLAGIVVWQHLAFRSGIRRELLEMAEELKDILDRDSGA